MYKPLLSPISRHLKTTGNAKVFFNMTEIRIFYVQNMKKHDIRDDTNVGWASQFYPVCHVFWKHHSTLNVLKYNWNTSILHPKDVKYEKFRITCGFQMSWFRGLVCPVVKLRKVLNIWQKLSPDQRKCPTKGPLCVNMLEPHIQTVMNTAAA
jgi:hypothetical protein